MSGKRYKKWGLSTKRTGRHATYGLAGSAASPSKRGAVDGSLTRGGARHATGSLFHHRPCIIGIYLGREANGSRVTVMNANSIADDLSPGGLGALT